MKPPDQQAPLKELGLQLPGDIVEGRAEPSLLPGEQHSSGAVHRRGPAQRLELGEDGAEVPHAGQDLAAVRRTVDDAQVEAVQVERLHRPGAERRPRPAAGNGRRHHGREPFGDGLHGRAAIGFLDRDQLT